MFKADQIVRVYEDLAYRSDRQGQPRLRDNYLVLAADAATTAGWGDEAERIRVQLLSFNPHHLLRPYGSFADALRSPDIQSYIEDLRTNHPPEQAGRELQQTQRGTEMEKAAAPKKPLAPLPTNGKGEESHAFPSKNSALGEMPPPPPQPVRVSPTVSRASQGGAAQKNKAALPDWVPSPTRKNVFTPPEEEPSSASRWFSSFLFVLVLLGSLALTAWTLFGPFLPVNWLP